MPARALAAALIERHMTVSTAESCTGGLISKLLTDVPGSSAYFLDGVVAYSDQSKTRLLGVPASLIAEHGAVSEPVAVAMAQGARRRSGADFAIAVTGIAGPGGGTPEKPVGLVFLAVADVHGCRAHKLDLGATATRAHIREQTALKALETLGQRLQEM